MRAFENRNNNRGRSCGYCHNPDHIITSCPYAEHDWLIWAKHEVPIVSSSGNKWYGWYRNDYTRWYKQSHAAYLKILAFREREKKKAAGTTPRRRAAPKCGFCAKAGHNRKNCTLMKQTIADARSANQRWRQALYDKLVKQLGISEGAAVKVNFRKDWREYEEAVGLIASVNWNEVSFLATGSCRVDYDYRSSLKIRVLVNGEQRDLRFTKEGLNDNRGESIVKDTGSSWNAATLLKVIGRAEKELDSKWVIEGMADEFDWLTKKRSWDRLNEAGVIRAINLCK